MFKRDVIDEQKAGDHVVVCHRLKREVLMPFDLGRGAGKFGVDLAVMKPKPRPDQLGTQIDGAGVAHRIGIDLGHFFGLWFRPCV